MDRSLAISQASSRGAGRLAALCPALLLLFLSTLSVGTLTLHAGAPAGGAVAALFAPWLSREEAFVRAAASGGRLIREGVLDTILVVEVDEPATIDRLHRLGAWFVLDPLALGGCLQPTRQPQAVES